MRFFVTLFIVSAVVAVVAVAVIMTGQYALADRFMAAFLNLQARLPFNVGLEQVLVMVTSVSVLVMALVITGCGVLLARMKARVVTAGTQKSEETVGAEQELARAKEALQGIEEQHRGELRQLLHLNAMFTERLDKRVLVQSIVEAASRATSTAQADSAVSLWLLNFGSDTFTFEKGMYCDQTMFMKSTFQMTDQPFAKVVETKQVFSLPAVGQLSDFMKTEKLTRLGSATSLMAIPLVIENTALGVLLVLCHPDVLTGYEERKVAYDLTWNQLTMALAIAIQGELAIVDRLTGVHNREYFLKRLKQEIDRANRYALPLSVLMIDVDNFKAVNDTLGHLQGDAVLKIVAKLIGKGVRAIDLVGRYGGEEFIVLLPETGLGKTERSVPGVSVVAERVRQAVEQEFEGMQKPLGITVSVGGIVRRFPEDQKTETRELIRLADEQLYRAKTSGKNRVCIFVRDGSEKGAAPAPGPSSAKQA